MSDPEGEFSGPSASHTVKTVINQKGDTQTSETTDGPLSDWFRVDTEAPSSKNTLLDEPQSETDPESEDHEMTVDEEDDQDDWFQILPRKQSPGEDEVQTIQSIKVSNKYRI